MAADGVYTSTLRLPRETADRLQLASIVTGRTIANLMAEAATALVDQLEHNPAHTAAYDRLRAAAARTAAGAPTENGSASE